MAGYNNTKGGSGDFKIVNSWGADWAGDGFAWLAYNSFRAKVKFVYFYFTLEGKFSLAILCDPFPEQPQITVDSIAVKANE
ncbi:hypothetical protein ACFL4P_00015 [Gemmatimonadota bacterium]